jgi:hypothetical protein
VLNSVSKPKFQERADAEERSFWREHLNLWGISFTRIGKSAVSTQRGPCGRRVKPTICSQFTHKMFACLSGHSYWLEQLLYLWRPAEVSEFAFIYRVTVLCLQAAGANLGWIITHCHCSVHPVLALGDLDRKAVLYMFLEKQIFQTWTSIKCLSRAATGSFQYNCYGTWG